MRSTRSKRSWRGRTAIAAGLVLAFVIGAPAVASADFYQGGAVQIHRPAPWDVHRPTPWDSH